MKSIKESSVGNVLSGWNSLPEIGPVKIKNASGARIQLESGEWYDDYIMGWGSCLLGHDSEIIKDAIKQSLNQGFLQQYETKEHELLSEFFSRVVPCAEKVRLVNSGLEATMYATRIARAVTGKKIIIKFEGHFHGLNDSLTWNIDTSAHSATKKKNGELERTPGTIGIPNEYGALTVPLQWNDLEGIENAFRVHNENIAGVILEPIALNIGCVRADTDFLEKLRVLTEKNGALLIFDEVLTGFRANLGGAQKELNITPDIATYGKAFGCGMPIAAIAGKADFMDVIAPKGPVQVSGTNTGRYLSVSVAHKVLTHLATGKVFQHIYDLEMQFRAGLKQVFDNHDIPCHIDSYGGRIGVHIGCKTAPKTMRDIEENYPRPFAGKLFSELSRNHKLYGFLMPLSFCPEPITLSAAHDLEMIESACNSLNLALGRVEFHEKKS